MSLIKRISTYFDEKGMSLSSVEKELGLGNGYLGKQIKNSGAVGSHILEKICANYKDLNPTWILTGKGEMLLPAKSQSKQTKRNGETETTEEKLEKYNKDAISKNIIESPKANSEISFVPVTNYADYIRGMKDKKWIQQLPKITITSMLPPGVYRAFEVRGDSMEPTFQMGDRVVSRLVEDYNNIRNKEVYVVVSSFDGIVTKRIEYEKKRKIFRCHSDSNSYPAYEIKTSDIFEVWKIESVYRMSIKTSPVPMLADMEKKGARKIIDKK